MIESIFLIFFIRFKEILIIIYKKKVNISIIILMILLNSIFKVQFLTIFNGKKIKLFYELLPFVGENMEKPNFLIEIFESNKLYINDANISKEYIKYIRGIEKKDRTVNNTYLWKDKTFSEESFIKRKDQLNYKEYGKLCFEEKLINFKKYEISKNPLISIIVPVYNKKDIILKSIRSIQNQSIKNIEIIIVDDDSNDNSYKIYNYLIESDPRIRIFYHLKNLGVWRTRIDGFLYSKGKYIIHFDAGDLYEDNYVLEDAFNIIQKYNIDSVKMICRFIYDYQNMSKSKLAIKIKDNFTKIAFKPNINRYDYKYFKNNGWIWTTLVKRNIYTKSLILLSERILNIYKNYCEDIWWRRLVKYVSESFLIIKRYSYLYFKNGKGEGDYKFSTEDEKNKMIQEELGFLYFNLEFLSKKDNKSGIINRLRKMNNNKLLINCGFLKTKFYLLDNLINEFIEDKFVSTTDKIFLKKLLKESKARQFKCLNNSFFPFLKRYIN